jgi:hypothetical protein
MVALLWGTMVCSWAQHTDPTQSKGISTHPDRAVNNEKPSKRNTFDWRQTSYPINSAYFTSRTSIPSSHHQNNNGNVSFLFQSKDVMPEDALEKENTTPNETTHENR